MARVKCSQCNGEGKIYDFDMRFDCDKCNGTGYVETSSPSKLTLKPSAPTPSARSTPAPAQPTNFVKVEYDWVENGTGELMFRFYKNANIIGDPDEASAKFIWDGAGEAMLIRNSRRQSFCLLLRQHCTIYCVKSKL